MSQVIPSISATIELARLLIQRKSVTPEDAGCQSLLSDRLEKAGFECEQINRNSVTNLWARRGTAKPLLVFAGHTDVVPTGPLEQWNFPPFDGNIQGNILHGRGAADMKGSIASFTCAVEQFVNDHPNHKGSIGFLITSDEEGPAKDGTVAVLDILAKRDEKIDMCIVGEPTSSNTLGDVIKVGRRGSLGGILQIHGVQGHIAYPHMAVNPIHQALPALQELTDIEWDQGNENFQPTSFQISNIHGGTGATNVIPGTIEITFNFRYSPAVTDQWLRQEVERRLTAHDLEFSIQWNLSGKPFETKQGTLVEAVRKSIKTITGLDTECSTSGGTSDGRFIAPTGAQVVELGPINATIHQVNEQISTTDLELLTQCYYHSMVEILV